MDIPKKLKAKVILLSNDGGKSWVVSRSYYVVDVQTDEFVRLTIQGDRLIAEPAKDNDHAR